MKTNNNIPAYRFQSYTDAWELRKIFEIADRFNNLRVPITSSLRIPGSTPYYGANGIQDYVEGYTHNGEFVLIAEDGANDLKNYPVNLVKGKIWVNNHAHVLQGKENIANNNFLAYSINRANIEALLVGGGRAKLNSDVLMNIELEIPSLKEQKAIGTFFSTLDQQITLHQRKLDTLKEQKKTYLKLLFPAKGQTKPALRFQGFEDDWEEVKVADIFQVTRGQVLSTNLVSDTKSDEYPYPVYSSQTKNNGLMGFYKDYLFDTAITWTTDGANAGTVRFREGKFYSTNVNGVLLSAEGYSNLAISEILNTVAWKYVSKVGNPKLMNNIMSEIILLIPGGFAEQQVLSSFFQTLDQEIAQVEDKLASLKEMKKTLLRKLFV
ncbi:restriction endonuclease subunit S [Streptococcus suis]